MAEYKLSVFLYNSTRLGWAKKFLSKKCGLYTNTYGTVNEIKKLTFTFVML